MTVIPHVNSVNFQEEVIQSPLPVLVDFSATWCGPCKMLEPVLEQLIQDWDGKARLVKLDVDDSPQLVMDYMVMGVPTLMLFKDGKVVERVTGYQPKERLEKKFLVHF